MTTESVPLWHDDYFDFADALMAERVEFVIVGAYALGVHGLARGTADIDFYVRATPENASKLMRALRTFGAPVASVGLSEADFSVPGGTCQLGVSPCRIDVLTELTGITWEEASRDVVVQNINGRSLPFLSMEALLKNKSQTGRPKDLGDVQRLKNRLARRAPK